MPVLQTVCGTEDGGGISYSYCIQQLPGTTSKDAVLYLHGQGGSEYEWQNSPFAETVYSQWGQAAPAVITISYGKTWLLAEKNSSSLSGLFEHFTQIALPALEAKLPFHPAHLILMGASMGGFNASQLYLKRPDLFSRIVLACPAIITFSPQAKDLEVGAYVARTGADRYYVDRALEMFSAFYPDTAAWSNAAPVDLASKMVTAQFPPVYVSCGDVDQYGFFEGAKAFADAVAKNGASSQWKLVPGPHCSFDVNGVASFVVPPTGQ